MRTPHPDDLWASNFSKTTRMAPGSSMLDYWTAPGGGPLHPVWNDKPHRLLCDLIGEILHLRATQDKAREVLTAFLRAPTICAYGAGSSSLLVQDFNLRSARALLAEMSPAGSMPAQSKGDDA